MQKKINSIDVYYYIYMKMQYQIFTSSHKNKNFWKNMLLWYIFSYKFQKIHFAVNIKQKNSKQSIINAEKAQLIL